MTEPQSPRSFPNVDLSPMASARWRHLALSGAAVGSAVMSSAAMAGVVQITQVGNQATSSANSLQADLSGDGMSDLPGLNVINGPDTRVTTFSDWVHDSGVDVVYDPPGTQISKRLGFAGHATFGEGTEPFTSTSRTAYYNIVGTVFNTPLKDASGMVPITFSDARINGGATTNALLEVRAISTSKTSHTVRLVRLVFDDASTAAPAGPGTTAGSSAPEYGSVNVTPPSAGTAAAAINSQIAKLTKQLRKASKTKKKAIAKKIKKLKAQLAAL